MQEKLCGSPGSYNAGEAMWIPVTALSNSSVHPLHHCLSLGFSSSSAEAQRAGTGRMRGRRRGWEFWLGNYR